MADLLFKCSGCSTPLAVEDDCVGQVIECPGCHGRVSVPQPGTFFRCTNSLCRVELTAPSSMVGEVMDCPNCETKQTIPLIKPLRLKKPTTAPTAAPSAQQICKKCPACGNALAPQAVICVNCGRNLITGKTYGQSTTATGGSQKSFRLDREGSGWMMRGVKFVLGSFVAWLLISNLVGGFRTWFSVGDRQGAETAKVEQQQKQAAVAAKTEQANNAGDMARKQRIVQALNPLIQDYAKAKAGFASGINFIDYSRLYQQATADADMAKMSLDALVDDNQKTRLLAPLTRLWAVTTLWNGKVERFDYEISRLQKWDSEALVTRSLLVAYPDLQEALMDYNDTGNRVGKTLYLDKALSIVMSAATEKITAAMELYGSIQR